MSDRPEPDLNGPRFQVLPYSFTGHCCFYASVVEIKDGAAEVFCEAFEEVDALRIAGLLLASGQDDRPALPSRPPPPSTMPAIMG